MALYSLEVEHERTANAATRAMQALHTQSVISSTFVARVGGAVETLARHARQLPDIAALAMDADALMRELEQGAALRSLMAEIPVIGVVTGHGGKTWLYRMRDGVLRSEALARDLTPLVASGGTNPRWRGLFLSFARDDPHAAMIYGMPLTPSGRPEDGWIGTVITMPWIARTLHALAGFQHAVPFFLDHAGRYIIFPVGRRLGHGPQSLGDEARQFQAPALLDVEKKLLAGEKVWSSCGRSCTGTPRPGPCPGAVPPPWPTLPCARRAGFSPCSFPARNSAMRPRNSPWRFFSWPFWDRFASGA